jgi:hypothetical protein
MPDVGQAQPNEIFLVPLETRSARGVNDVTMLAPDSARRVLRLS